MKELLGYNEELLEVDGEFDYVNRSYIFSPIYETPPGYIVTQAVMMCRDCRSIIKYTGGGGNRYVCTKCYPALKLADFAEGHTHEILGKDEK